VPLGVDPARFKPGLEPLSLSTQKGFKFLFVGGTLYRKGIDILLDAYAAAFTPDDDVCLVIKDMGVNTFYRDQNSGERIRAMQADAGCPEILYLTEDMPGEKMPHLYAACDCLVHPYRGEGFGLPVAEAMACALPVIVTAGGACDDFCQSDTAYLVPAQRQSVRFAEETAGQAWLLEPDLDTVKAQMLTVFAAPEKARQLGSRAAQKIRVQFSWQQAALKARVAIEQLIAQGQRRDLPLAAPNPVQETAVGAEIPKDVDLVYLSGAHRMKAVHGETFSLESAQTVPVGKQLGTVLDNAKNPFLMIVGERVQVPQEAMAILRDYLMQEQDVAMVFPVMDQDQPGVGIGLSECDIIRVRCVLIRRSVLLAIGGFDGAFRTDAAVDNAARVCRRHGLRVVEANPLRVAQEVVVDELLADEKKAVEAIERGDRLRDGKHYEKALEQYRQAVATKPDFIEAVLVLGDLLLALNRAADAATVMRGLTDLDPRSCWAWNYLGLAQYQGKEGLAARVSFTKALELHGEFAEAMVNLGVLEWDEGNEDAALRNFEQALRLDPTNRDLVINLGMIYAQTKKLKQAEDLLSDYLEKSDQDLDVKALLAEVMEKGFSLNLMFHAASVYP